VNGSTVNGCTVNGSTVNGPAVNGFTADEPTVNSPAVNHLAEGWQQRGKFAEASGGNGRAVCAIEIGPRVPKIETRGGGGVNERAEFALLVEKLST